MAKVPASVVKQAKAMGLDLNRCTIEGGTLADADKEHSGRPTGRYKNKTELRYAEELELQQAQGNITWWDYEPWTLVIVESNGKKCRFTPDFVVRNGDGTIVCVEIKGFLREAARIRFLAARERYPFLTFKMLRRERGAWEELL